MKALQDTQNRITHMYYTPNFILRDLLNSEKYSKSLCFRFRYYAGRYRVDESITKRPTRTVNIERPGKIQPLGVDDADPIPEMKRDLIFES